MKKLWTLGLGLLAAVSLTANAAYWEHTKEEAQQNLMDFACNVLYWECEGLAPPTIVYVYDPYVGWAGAFWDGTTEVYINTYRTDQMDPLEVMGVIVHEFTHYIDDQLHDLGKAETRQDICDAEARAWHVGNSFLVWVGLGSETTYNWWQWYGCPSPGPVTGP